jgi:hypothetical protein
MVTTTPPKISLAFQRSRIRLSPAHINRRDAHQLAAQLAAQRFVKDFSFFLLKVACATVAAFVVIVLCLAL